MPQAPGPASFKGAGHVHFWSPAVEPFDDVHAAAITTDIRVSIARPTETPPNLRRV